MSVSRNNSTTPQSRPDILLNRIIRNICPQSILHLHNPSQNFLIRKSMKRSGKTIQPSRKRQHWTRQCRPDKMCSMSRNIPSFMIGMDGQIQSHEFDELFVFTVAHQMGEIVSVIFTLVDGLEFAVFVDVTVDAGGDGGEFGDEGHGVFKDIFPVFLLVDTLCIGLSESGSMF